MSPYVLVILNIIDKSLDLTGDLIDIDNKYNRRIIKYKDKEAKYLSRLNASKILLKSAIADSDKQKIAKFQKECEYYNEIYLYYKDKVKEYEELYKNNSNSSN